MKNETDRTSATGTSIEDQSQSGVRLSVTWQVGVRTDITLNGARVDQEREAGRKSRLNSAGLTAVYRLGERSDVSLGYTYNEQQPRGSAANDRDYVANVVSLLFTITI